MSAASHCSRCGATLAANASACSRCLFELGLSRPPAELDPDPEPASSTHARRPRGPAPTLAELAPLFPQLELLELLGEGGMGVVYKARQRQLGRLVALKVLPREASADPAFVERFAREARALAQLDHPRIVRVYDHGDAHGHPYLILEYVDGENLRQRMRRGALDPREALRLVPQICDALQYAHDEGVVHRDIKPENILIARDGRVKVADFGLARLTGAEPEPALTRAGEAVGTPHYMAPEQLERPRDVDHRADIYALGVVFYELLTGTLPRGKFDAPSHRVQVDVRVDEIVLKSLEHEPELRYQHALEMSDEVQAVERGPAAPATPQSAQPPAESVALVARRASHWFGWSLAFALCWSVAAFAFNDSLLALGCVGLVLVALYIVAVVALCGLRPIGPRLLAGRAGFAARRGASARRATGVLLVGAGFALLALGLVGLWERWSPGLTPPPRELASLQQRLAIGAQLPLELVTNPSLVHWDVDDTARWLQRPWLLAAAALLLACGGALTLAGSGVTRERAWPAAASALACCCAPLALYHAGAWLRAAAAAPPVLVETVVTSARMPGPPLHALMERVPLCLFDDGYRLSARAYLFPNAVAEGAPASTALVLALAEPAAVQQRWHIGLLGPRRVRPSVVLNVRRADVGAGWELQADLGRIEQKSARHLQWSAAIQSLLACALGPLESPAGSADR